MKEKNSKTKAPEKKTESNPIKEKKNLLKDKRKRLIEPSKGAEESLTKKQYTKKWEEIVEVDGLPRMDIPREK